MEERSRENITSQERRQIALHLPGIIKTLGEHLYSEKSVAVRELIQNANDSLVRRRVADGACPSELRIEIGCDYSEDVLSIRDNGAGMTEHELERHLSTVGRSGTDEFRKAIEQHDPEQARKLIGQFGLGFLSAFVIAQSIEVRTRSFCADAPGLIWTCDGSTDYTVARRNGIPVGTEVVLRLHREHDEFADEDHLTPLIRRYADFVAFPIYLGDALLPVNVQQAPWHGNASTAEFLDYVQKRFQDEPLEIIPLQDDDAERSVGGVLYVPESRHSEGGEIELYVSRMYVGCDRELLPEWARFIRGVIDTPSLDITTSRETAVHNAKYRNLQALIGARLTSFIADLARDDPPRFHRLIKTHEPSVKIGALKDDRFYDHVKNLVQFDSDSGAITLPKYLERVARYSTDPVKTIYFHTGGVESRQHQLLFAANGIPVIDAEEAIDRAFLEKYAEQTKGIRVKSVDHAADSLFQSVPTGRLEHVIAHYADMNIEAKAVSFKPPSVPALLVRKPQADRQHMLQALLEDDDMPEEVRGLFEALAGNAFRMEGDGWLLHLNTNNEVIRLLAELTENEDVATQCMREIYNSAYLVAVKGLSIHEVEKMAQIHTETVVMLLKLARAVGERAAAAEPKKGFWGRILER